MRLVRIGKVLFNLNDFVYAENNNGIMHNGCRIWLNPHGSMLGAQTPGTPPSGFKPYVDVDAKLWEIQEAIEKASVSEFSCHFPPDEENVTSSKK